MVRILWDGDIGWAGIVLLIFLLDLVGLVGC
jgi:hypothetical protein